MESEHYTDMLSARQKLAASNVANAGTPEYKTKDIDFQFEFMSQIRNRAPNVMDAPGLAVRTIVTTLASIRKRACFRKTLCGSTWLPPRSRRVSRDDSILSAFGERLGFGGGAHAGRTSDGKPGEFGNHPHPGGGAYKCKDAVFISTPQTSGFSAVSQTELGSGVNGVEVSDVVEDTRAPDQRYIP